MTGERDRYRHVVRKHGQGHLSETGLGTRTGTGDKGQGTRDRASGPCSGLETGGSDKYKGEGQKQGKTEK